MCDWACVSHTTSDRSRPTAEFVAATSGTWSHRPFRGETSLSQKAGVLSCLSFSVFTMVCNRQVETSCMRQTHSQVLSIGSSFKMNPIRRLSDADVRSIFESLHENKRPPPDLPFQIVPVGPNGLKLSPPSYEFEGKRSIGDRQSALECHLFCSCHRIADIRSQTVCTYC